MTGVDKAQNNISFICRQFYLKNVEDEFSSTKTYILSDRSEEDTVKDHVTFCNKYKIPVTDLTVPFMHIFLKMISDLIKRRYDEKKLKYINVSANFKAS